MSVIQFVEKNIKLYEILILTTCEIKNTWIAQVVQIMNPKNFYRSRAS